MALTLSHGGDTIFSTTTRSEEVLVGTKEGIVFLKRNGGGSELKYGVSITDACIGWEETENLLQWTHEQAGSVVTAGTVAD